MNHWFLRGLRKGDKGIAAIEFALVLPVLMLMLVAVYDLSNLILCNNRANQTAQDLNNIITRGPVTLAQLNDILTAAPLIMQPFNFNANGKVIVTAVTQSASGNSLPPPTKAWTQSYGGGAGASKIVLGGLPGGLILNSGQTVIFTEVFYTYTGVFTAYSFTSGNVYQIAAGVPRQGNMAIPPA